MIQGAQTGAGDYVYENTGSPLLGALTQAVVGGAPDIAGIKIGAKALPKGRRYSIGDVGTQGSKFGGKQRGVFAGINAEGAPVEQYMKAQEMLDRGVDPRTIWNETAKSGAPIKVDKAGNLTHEISDFGASFTPLMQEMVDAGDRLPVSLRDVLDHPELYAAYPDIASTRFALFPEKGARGSFSEIRNRIEVNPKDFADRTRSLEDILSTAVHEIQHKIQSVEELPRGGNADVGSAIAEDADRAYKLGRQGADLIKDQAKAIESASDYAATGGLLSASRKLDEINRLKGYLQDYYRGGNLTDKRRHILNSGSAIMDHNDEYRMRMDIPWAKKHRPKSERNQNYADYIEKAIAYAESNLDPDQVGIIQQMGVKSPTQKLSRSIDKINKQTRPLYTQANDMRKAANQAFQFGGGAVPEDAVFSTGGKYYARGVTDDKWAPIAFDTPEQAYNAARSLYAGENNYKALSGEVEARLVQDRLRDLSPESLSSTNPYNMPILNREYPLNKQISLGRDYRLGNENIWTKLLTGAD